MELSKSVPEAKTLSERLAKFVDKEAHWAAALYSTQAVDILMRKPIFAFLQMSAVAVLVFVGFLLTLSPLKMERVRRIRRHCHVCHAAVFIRCTSLQTFPPTIQRNTTVTEKIERYNTSSVVCWVAACFLLLSFCFAWLRSPRSGRVVFALGVLAVFLSQGLVYVVWDPYNSDLYVEMNTNHFEVISFPFTHANTQVPLQILRTDAGIRFEMRPGLCRLVFGHATRIFNNLGRAPVASGVVLGHMYCRNNRVYRAEFLHCGDH